VPWAPGGGRGHGTEWRSLAGGVCVGEEGGQYEQLADRCPSAEADGGHELSKEKVNALRHALVRMLLPCSYATPWGLRLELLSCPGSAPLPPGSGRRDHGCGAAIRRVGSGVFQAIITYSL
jgi:hypothetical protein